MKRFQQILFSVSVLALSWFAMMAVHECGHVLGALGTGGTVERVVLHPLTISRTDVSPNPNPFAVVWLGPLLGCVVPIAVWLAVPSRHSSIKKTAGFFAGFCLVANGAYIGIGSIDRIGDSGTMLKHGSPLWLLIAFGMVAAACGLYLWHRIGSIKGFLSDPSLVDAKLAYGTFVSLLIFVATEFVLSPR